MRILRLLAFMVIALLVVVGHRWYSYVTNTDSPYDEVGIEFNSRMPAPVRKWGCDRLRETFGNVLPPLGCQAGPGNRDWI